ncbi:MAG: hypothetical protein Kow0040_25310 [Thermogutta sp.]
MRRRRKSAVGAQRLRCDFEALRRYIHIGIHLGLTPEALFRFLAQGPARRRKRSQFAPVRVSLILMPHLQAAVPRRPANVRCRWFCRFAIVPSRLENNLRSKFAIYLKAAPPECNGDAE